jgi:hypothetical protein
LGLLWLIVARSDFQYTKWLHYGKQYVLVRNRFYKGLMLRINDEKNEVWAIKKGACRGMNMHFEWGPLLNLSLIHVVGQVSESMLEASVGCHWVGQNERKEDRSGKLMEIYP